MPSDSRWTVLRAAAIAGILAGCTRGAPATRAPVPSSTESAPSTDIYLYRLGRIVPFGDRLTNVTARRGYDNQPAWDGEALVFTAQVGGQTDIYRYAGGAVAPVTDTPESEYSASLTPDGAGISVVRVERDSTQRLWRFPHDGGTPSVILPDVKPVGYYAWLDSTTVTLFVLGEPNTLRIADTRTGVARIATSGIGRSLQRIPGGRRGSFVQRSGSSWVLKTIDPQPRSDGSFRIDSLVTLPDSAEYVSWRSDRVVYTAGGSRIWRLRLPDRRWTLVANLSSRGILGITRIALSPDGSGLAFVASDP